MKKTFLLIFGIILCLTLAIGAYSWAMAMMDSIYAYRSPLADNPPQPGAELGSPATRRVVIVLVDGLRVDTASNQEIMPILDYLRRQGASAVVHSRASSYSETAYATLLTGAWQKIHDGPIFNLEYEKILPVTQDMVFTAAHRAGLKTAVSGYYWFEKLIPVDVLDDTFFTQGEDRQADVEVVDAALDWLEAGTDQLMLIHLDQVDYAGHHEGGAKSKAWDEAAARVDVLIARVLAGMDLQKDTLMVFSDHGHIDAGGHGGTEKIVLTQPFVMAGAGVIPGEYGNIDQVDIAPTIAALLGTNLPASTQGQVRTAMLNLPEQTLVNLPTAMQSQQEHLVQSYSAAIGVLIPSHAFETRNSVAAYQALLTDLRVERTSQERLPRAIISAAILGLLAFLLVRFWKSGLPWKVLGSLVFLVMFNLVFGVILGKSYSFSIIEGVMEFVLLIFACSSIGFLAAWLFTALASQQFKRRPMDAALQTLALALVTIGLLLIPLAIHFTLNGALLSWTMPNWFVLFIGLLSMVLIIATAILGILFSGVSALVSTFTTKKG